MARYALNLPAQLKEEATHLAKKQGVSLNQFILWSVADKVGELRHTLDDPRFPQITYRTGASGVAQAVLRGTGIRVQTIAVSARQWGESPELLADEYDRPLLQIKEALAFYDAHKSEIDAHIEAES
jgi:uncharacterized protein (DUF433 family)